METKMKLTGRKGTVDEFFGLYGFLVRDNGEIVRTPVTNIKCGNMNSKDKYLGNWIFVHDWYLPFTYLTYTPAGTPVYTPTSEHCADMPEFLPTDETIREGKLMPLLAWELNSDIIGIATRRAAFWSEKFNLDDWAGITVAKNEKILEAYRNG